MRDLAAFYRRCNPLCNEHRFDGLGEFLGVPATGRVVTTREFAIYRVAAGRVAEVWVTADNLRLLSQLREPC